MFATGFDYTLGEIEGGLDKKKFIRFNGIRFNCSFLVLFFKNRFTSGSR